jgi:hypothetical protein
MSSASIKNTFITTIRRNRESSKNLIWLQFNIRLKLNREQKHENLHDEHMMKSWQKWKNNEKMHEKKWRTGIGFLTIINKIDRCLNSIEFLSARNITVFQMDLIRQRDKKLLR